MKHIRYMKSAPILEQVKFGVDLDNDPDFVNQIKFFLNFFMQFQYNNKYSF